MMALRLAFAMWIVVAGYAFSIYLWFFLDPRETLAFFRSKSLVRLAVLLTFLAVSFGAIYWIVSNFNPDSPSVDAHDEGLLV